MVSVDPTCRRGVTAPAFQASRRKRCGSRSWTVSETHSVIGCKITSDPENACTPGGWPPDPLPAPDGNGSVQIDDVFFAAGRFNAGAGDPDYTPRALLIEWNRHQEAYRP